MPKFLHLYSIATGLFYAFVTPAICVALVYFVGGVCWPQRLGALYVGAAVLVQGLMAANEDRFSRKLSDGTNLRGHINGLCFFAAVFGTIFAAFGDLIPSSFFYGVPMCSG